MNEVASPVAKEHRSAAPESGPVASMVETIQGLRQLGVQQFDPVRFEFIEAMATRALEQRAAVTAVLEQKVKKAVVALETDFLRHREQSAVQLASLCDAFPDASEQGQTFFEAGDFKSLKRLADRCQRENHILEGGQAMTALAELSAQINQSGFAANNQSRENNFARRLRQHEDLALGSSYLKKADVSAEGEDARQVDLFNNHLQGDQIAELDSVRVFRESLVKLNSDKLVTRVISEGPESPGPLNPQGLVIKSLATMRELSPDYLNRFVSYIDTLLWLEQASPKKKPAKRKRKSPKANNKPA